RWVERHFSLFHGAVEIYYIRWKQTGDPAHLEHAFRLAEKSKSLLLLESMRKSQAERIAGVPDSLLEKERRLGTELNRLEKWQLNALNAGDPETARRAGADIAEARQELQALVQDFERHYPAYFQMKYALRTASTDQLRQRILQPGQALVEFFTSDSAVFVFVLTQKDFRCLRLAIDFPLENWVTELRRSLQAYPNLTGEAASAQAKIFTERAFWIWQKIWSPIAPPTTPPTPKGEMALLPEKIILVPDGALAYLPFEALLEEMPADFRKFKTHRYLLCKHQISYAYSATQLLEIAENQAAASAFAGALAFAPSFENSPAGLRPLKFNQVEAKAAYRIFGGDLRLASEATLAEFFRLTGAADSPLGAGGAAIGDYQILLLATHGQAGASVGDLSRLAFTFPADSVGEAFLYLRDLYDLRLPAQLVILSACETGVGEYRSGEGVLSLARGFFQAGARSLVTTLWSVDDAKNARLMEEFFRCLKAGMDKDEALRKAKLAYLKSRPHDEAHPVFWAAAVAVGEMEGLEFQGFSWWWAAAVVVVLVLLAGYFWRNRAQS
ncbi:MAG: CHAT domain-containing protein, partial [Bacteroidota bacterium]